MPGKAAWMQWNVPVRLTAIMDCHKAESVRSKRSLTAWPALFTSTSTGPNSASAWAKAVRTDASSAMSALTACTCPRLARLSAAASSAAPSRPRSVTRAPRCSSARAQASPMPRAPPVTRAWRPAKGCRVAFI
ncbi:hypothetical protein D9M68_479520 [compost metagenome]